MIDGRDTGEAAAVWLVVLGLVAAAIICALVGQTAAYVAVGMAVFFYGAWWALG